jgi:hypothetical protein
LMGFLWLIFPIKMRLGSKMKLIFGDFFYQHVNEHRQI